MPYVWEVPETFVDYRGVKVYRTYKNEMMSEPHQHQFSLTPSGDYPFDARYLPTPYGILKSQLDLRIMHAIDLQDELLHWTGTKMHKYRERLTFPVTWHSLPRHLMQRLTADFGGFIRACRESGETPATLDDFYRHWLQLPGQRGLIL